MRTLTAAANGQVNLSSVVNRVIQDINTIFPSAGAGPLVDVENPWAQLDLPPTPLQCDSKAAIAAAEMQQIGYATANVRLAYATGALPPGKQMLRSREHPGREGRRTIVHERRGRVRR